MLNQNRSESFVFVGEALILDLINTVVVIRGKRRDLLETPQDLARWWELAHQHHHLTEMPQPDSFVYDDALLEAVKAFRDSQRRLFSSVVEGKHPGSLEIDLLNSVLEMGYPALEWPTAGTPGAVYRVRNHAQAGLLVPTALSSLRLLTETDHNRLHKCHNERCILLFYDTTKSGTRQWCSPGCLDRERSIKRYRAKQHT
jgi:predicted RNA-binding Zn ribbon-like protein